MPYIGQFHFCLGGGMLNSQYRKSKSGQNPFVTDLILMVFSALRSKVCFLLFFMIYVVHSCAVISHLHTQVHSGNRFVHTKHRHGSLGLQIHWLIDFRTTFESGPNLQMQDASHYAPYVGQFYFRLGGGILNSCYRKSKSGQNSFVTDLFFVFLFVGVNNLVSGDLGHFHM